MQEQNAAQTAANPAGYRYCSDDAYIRNDADVPSVLEEAFTNLPSKNSFSLYFAMNPTSRRGLDENGERIRGSGVGAGDMALSMQSDHYFAVYSVWNDENDNEKCKDWVSGVFRGVEPHSVGSYLGDADFRVRRTRFWGEEEGKRVMELRRLWDPDGRICGYLGGDLEGEALSNEL
jgi:hypothetical protein